MEQQTKPQTKCRVVEAEPKHAASLGPRMNTVDKFVCEVIHKQTPEQCILTWLEGDAQAVVDDDDVCYAVFGDCKGDNLGRVVWFCVSEDFMDDRRRQIQFVREYRTYLKELLDTYPFLYNYTFEYPNGEKYRRLIEFMGFKFTPTKHYQHDDLCKHYPFRFFYQGGNR